MNQDLTGRTVANRYLLESLLAGGGMVAKYRASDTNLGRTVTVNILEPAFVSDPTVRRRFLEGARIVAGLNHPAIIRVFDYAESGDTLFNVAEYASEGDLYRFLARRQQQDRPLPLWLLLTIFAAIADGLNYLHQEGLIHRDVKPANILIDRAGSDEDNIRAKLAGFSSVKLREGAKWETAEGEMLGTPAYMAPEMFRDDPIDGRADIYSLGVALFEASTGRVPFPADDVRQAMASHLTTPAPDPRQINPELPSGLARIMQRAMAKSPADRYPNGTALAQELRQISNQLRLEAPQVSAPRLVERRAEPDAAPAEPDAAPAGRPPVAGAIPPEPVADRLQVRQADGSTTTLDLTADNYTIGRLPENDIPLDEKRVSRQHAVLARDGEGWTVTDAGSSNGTYLDGNRLAPKAPEPWPAGTLLEIGAFQLTWAPAPRPEPSEILTPAVGEEMATMMLSPEEASQLQAAVTGAAAHEPADRPPAETPAELSLEERIQALLDEGQLEEALSLAQGVEGVTAQDEAIAYIARQLAQRGDIHQASTTALLGTDNRSWDEVILAAAAAGELDEFLALARDRATDEFQWAQDLTYTARVLAQAGNLEAVGQWAAASAVAVQNMRDESRRRELLRQIRQSQVEAGLPPEKPLVEIVSVAVGDTYEEGETATANLTLRNNDDLWMHGGDLRIGWQWWRDQRESNALLAIDQVWPDAVEKSPVPPGGVVVVPNLTLDVSVEPGSYDTLWQIHDLIGDDDQPVATRQMDVEVQAPLANRMVLESVAFDGPLLARGRVGAQLRLRNEGDFTWETGSRIQIALAWQLEEAEAPALDHSLEWTLQGAAVPPQTAVTVTLNDLPLPEEPGTYRLRWTVGDVEWAVPARSATHQEMVSVAEPLGARPLEAAIQVRHSQSLPTDYWPGEPVHLELAVKNVSGFDWPAGTVSLRGAIAPAGTEDNPKLGPETALAEPVPDGQAGQVTLQVPGQLEAGDYWITFDIDAIDDDAQPLPATARADILEVTVYDEAQGRAELDRVFGAGAATTTATRQTVVQRLKQALEGNGDRPAARYLFEAGLFPALLDADDRVGQEALVIIGAARPTNPNLERWLQAYLAGQGNLTPLASLLAQRRGDPVRTWLADLLDLHYQGELEAVMMDPSVTPGHPVTARLRVQNAGNVAWPAGTALEIFFRWHDAEGRPLTREDEHWTWQLAEALDPGAPAEHAVTVTAPDRPAAYEARWFVSQPEWDADASAVVPVAVRERDEATDSPAGALPGPSEEVEPAGDADSAALAEAVAQPDGADGAAAMAADDGRAAELDQAILTDEVADLDQAVVADEAAAGADQDVGASDTAGDGGAVVAALPAEMESEGLAPEGAEAEREEAAALAAEPEGEGLGVDVAEADDEAAAEVAPVDEGEAAVLPAEMESEDLGQDAAEADGQGVIAAVAETEDGAVTAGAEPVGDGAPVEDVRVAPVVGVASAGRPTGRWALADSSAGGAVAATDPDQPFPVALSQALVATEAEAADNRLTVTVTTGAVHVRLLLDGEETLYAGPNQLRPRDLLRLSLEPLAYGETLFRAILHPTPLPEQPADTATLAGYRRAESEASGNYRLELFIDPAVHHHIDPTDLDLHSYWWERLKAPDESGVAYPPLATIAAAPFYRRLLGPSRRPPAEAQPLRLLAAICNPAALGQADNRYLQRLTPVDVAQERAILGPALERLQSAEALNYAILGGPEAPASWARLIAALHEGVQILHLVAHGLNIDNQYFLVMEDEAGAYRLASVGDLQSLFRAAPDLRLIILTACQSAVDESGSVFRGLGPRLVRAGVPAVIAMQDLIPVQGAQLFHQFFYDELAHSGRVDEAVAAARHRLYEQDPTHPQWSMPVLFIGHGDGRLFSIPAAVAARLPRLEKATVRSYAELDGDGDPGARRHPTLPEKIAPQDGVAGREPAEAPLARAQSRSALDEAIRQPLQLDARALQAHIEAATPLRLTPAVYDQVAAALNAGKHLVLTGPPGTGKTSLAQTLADYARQQQMAAGAVMTTATAEWSTFDTIGGYVPTARQTLRFRPGTFLEAIRTGRWLVIDEMNRAEIDKAFGELFTVLSGQPVELTYRIQERPVRIVPGAARTLADWYPALSEDAFAYVIHPNWRIIGTMNVYDKSYLYGMSFAFMRRFAFIEVDVPQSPIYQDLVAGWLHRYLQESAAKPARDPDLAPLQRHLEALLHSQRPLMRRRALGPAIVQDMLLFVGDRYRQSPEPADLPRMLAEAFMLYVVPQLDGLDLEAIFQIYEQVATVFPLPTDDRDTVLQSPFYRLRQRIQSLYLHVLDWSAATPERDAAILKLLEVDSAEG